MSRHGVLASALSIEPGAAERKSAASLREAVGHRKNPKLILRLPDGAEIAVPKALVQILLASADEMAEGHAVTVLPSDVLLTPAEAGELLGLSRPFVARLLDQGDIESQHVPGSRHRRVRLNDVLEFQARRDRRRTGRQAIAAAAVDAGLPY